MACVYKRENETLDSMLKRFKNLVQNEGIIEEYKKKEVYIAPSLKRRLKSENAQKREKKYKKALAKKYGYSD